MLDAFLVALNVAAFFGYSTIPLDVFFPERVLLTSWLPPGKRLLTWIYFIYCCTECFICYRTIRYSSITQVVERGGGNTICCTSTSIKSK